jgi:glutamate-1-semialdehyde 2,1-aminomutase
LIANYNDLDSVKELFIRYTDQIAAVILEPVVGNMGVVIPQSGFLQGLRDLCTQYGSVLIFDEVMTGFRVSKGGAQTFYGIRPDLSTFGKIIGGGLPVGAYGGKQEIMDMLAPKGPVYQAGTLSGNPLAMAAGLTALKILDETDGFYQMLEDKSARLGEGIKKCLADLNFPGVVNRVGSMFTLFFTEETQVTSYAEASKCNTVTYAKFFKMALESGIYLAPSQFEAGFMSAAHTTKKIDKTIEATYEALKVLKG